jgi:NADH-quinone oxidoreductase subunit G
LPGLRPVQDAKARVDVQTVWGINQLPTKTGKSTDEILKDSDVILLGGVDANDISSSAKSQLSNKKIISMDIRFGTSTEVAHVILPVASVVEKNGTFLDWQVKPRSFESAVESLNRSDVRILSMLADEMKRPINLPTVKAAANEIAQFDKWEKSTSNWHVSGTNTENLNLGPTEAILNSWRLLLDRGSLQEGEDNLAGTARKTIIGLNKTKAEKLNLVEGELVKISADSVAISAPLKIVETEENIVWVPRNSTGAQLVSKFSKPSGIKVSVSKA